MGNLRSLGLYLIFISIFLFATTYTCLGVGNVTVMCSQKERLALLKFKGSVKDASGILSSWVGNDCCRWEGIQCDSLTRTVESLHLNDLVGNEVNSSLAELRHLKCLDLSWNDFQGSRIPEFIGSFKQLRYLDLSHAGFQGIIPPHIGNLSNLKVLGLSEINLSLAWNFGNMLNMFPFLLGLNLSSCGLTKTFLSSHHLNISVLSNIQHLDLSFNSIEGTIPSFFTNMSSLRVLDLSGNMLNSWVPVMPNLLELDLSFNMFKQIEHLGIWRRCHLKHLSASHNSLRIETPQNVSECSRYALELLDLSWCSNGTIPEPLGRLTNLRFLYLLRSHLTGPIPESLGRLRFLEVLDLSNNQLIGPVPTFLGNLGSLESLYLEYNRLTGPIPTSLGRLVSLQEFSVHSNFLNGTLPVSVGLLDKLSWLDISHNSLEGVVSEAHFAKLSMLEFLDASSNTKLTCNFSHKWIPPFQLIDLDLSSCNIANGFPQWIQYQRSLNVLVLSNTTISGPLPTWLRKMPVIHFLDLSHNKLCGPLTNLPDRESVFAYGGAALILVDNIFNGSIPRSLCRRTDLKLLDLSRNRLTGTIPKCLENLQGLGTMIFSSNLLSGVIPSYIGLNHLSLNWLKVDGNNFIGELPRELGNLADLRVLDVGDNQLFGNIPNWIGEKLTNIMILRLHGNNFTGEIPESFCKMSKLQILDVGYNNLTGIIPHCLRELNAMVKGGERWYLYTSDSNENVIQGMKGVAREYTNNLFMFYNLDLSSNKLFGEMPVELTALKMLVGLNLSNNHLSGSIPYNIGNMTRLESLDFSNNELTGMIPPSMAALTFLSHLNLSHNNLSGRIPTGHQLQTLIDDPSIYGGNRDLCGPPLTNNCSDHQDPTTTAKPKKKHKAAEESIKVWWFYLDIMSGFATGFWGVIGVLLLKKQWRWRLFMFVEKIMDKIYVAVMVTVVAKIKRGREAA